MTKRQLTTLTVLTILALVLGLLLSRRLWFRLDLTKNKAYTISAISRDLHTEIPDQVRITYYVSDKLAAIHPMPGEIEDLLREYAAYSRGKIRLTVRDPAKANMVQEIEGLGLQPQQIQTVEQDQASIATVYTGIVIEYLERMEVLPVVFSLDTLEYDLTSRIRALLSGEERLIGVLLGDGYRQWNNNYNYLNQALVQAGYRVRLLSPGEEISDALPGLFVIGGVEDLDEWALYRIDRYIQGGGKVLFALDAVYVDTVGSLEARVMIDQGLLSMVSFYGATIKPELVLDRSARTLQYQTQQNPNGPIQIKIVRYPHWVGVLGENGNRGHPVSARFAGADLFWPSHIELNPPEGVEAEPLFTTTAEAWVQKENFATNPDMAYLMERDGSESPGKKNLAVSLTGSFPGWFKGVPKPVREGSDEELPDLPPEARPSRIVVISDSDMVTDLLQYTQGQHNLDFVLQALEWLGNDGDLTGIRSRQSQTGRLDKIIDEARRAQVMGFAQFLNVILIPLAVLGAGLIFAWKRRARANAVDTANAAAGGKQGSTEGSDNGI
ncbi:hypothetical protein AGMMS49587_04070 [Spirochaetia bacterium]|nr:hypothetical protein AGMMS49587_04070 [Spirochaetia bacterium]